MKSLVQDICNCPGEEETRSNPLWLAAILFKSCWYLNDRLVADSAGSQIEPKMATSGSAFDAELSQRIKNVKDTLAVRIPVLKVD